MRKVRLTDLGPADQRRIERANQAKADRDWRLARRRWRALTRRRPHAWFWHEIAICECNLGRLPEAIAACRHAARLAPRSAFTQETLGHFLLEIGRPRVAERALRRAVARKPTPEAFVFLSNILVGTGRPKEARLALRGALRVAPRYEEAYFNLAGLDLADGDTPSAIRRLRKAIELDPDYQLAHAELGRLLCRDAPDEALALLRRAVALAPTDHWSILYLANLTWRAGDLDAAERWYRQAIAARPGDAVVLWALGDFLIRSRRDLARGTRLVQQALAIDPRDRQARASLRRAQAMAGGQDPGFQPA